VRVTGSDINASSSGQQKDSRIANLRRFYLTVLGTPLLAAPTSAQAYIGPGAELGAIAVFVVLALGVILLLAGLVWFPLVRLFKGRKSHCGEPDGTSSQN